MYQQRLTICSYNVSFAAHESLAARRFGDPYPIVRSLNVPALPVTPHCVAVTRKALETHQFVEATGLRNTVGKISADSMAHLHQNTVQIEVYNSPRKILSAIYQRTIKLGKYMGLNLVK